MALMKKPKQLNINFNFSDDSDDEKDTGSSNVQTKNILKDLKIESNHTEGLAKYLYSADDKTIISSDHLHTSELPSFCEDFGLPVTESTCLDDFGSDQSLYLTALGDDLNQSQPYHKTVAENKRCHISHRTVAHKPHKSTIKNNSASSKENLNLTNKGEIISRASALLQKPVTDNQDSGWRNIGETPRKGNKASVKHRLYENDEVVTSLRVDGIDARINCIPLFQNKFKSVSVQPDAWCSASSNEQSLFKDQSFTESFVEVQDTSVQTSFSIDDIIPESTEKHVCELQKSMPDCEDSVQSELSLFDSPNQATYTKVCEKSSGLSDSSADTDDSQDDVLASSYEVQDISVQTSFVEPQFPDGKSAPEDIEHSSVAHKCIEPYLQNIHKSFMEMNIQNNQDELCGKKATLSDDDKEHSKCSHRKNTKQVIDGFITNIHKTEYDITPENGKIDNCTIARGGEVNRDQTGNGFGTYQDRHNECSVKQTNISLNCSEDHRNVYRCELHDSDGEQSGDILAAASESENEDKQDVKQIEFTALDGEQSGDILAAASDSEDKDNQDTVDKIKEDEFENCDEDGKHSDCHHVNRTKCRTIGSRVHNLTVTNYEREEKYGASGKILDAESADKTEVKTWEHTEDNQGPNGDSLAKTLTKTAMLVNVDRIRRQVSESSDDDSDFENFLKKMKSSTKPKKSVGEEMPMNEFIIDDDDSSNATDDDEDEVFYIRTNKELDEMKNKRRSPPRFQENADSYYHSDVSGSDIDDSDSDLDDSDSDFDHSDSDLDNFIVDMHPKKKDAKIKSTKTTFDLSSDESLLDTKPASKSKAKTTSTQQGKSQKCNDDNKKLDAKQSKVSRRPEKDTNCSSRTTTHRASSEDGNCISRQQGKTPFQIPRCVEQWKHPFETPARLDMKNDGFKTPRNLKGLEQHPTTAPRPAFRGDGVNDNVFFMKSLSTDMAYYLRHADAARFLKRFKETKVELTQKIFNIFNHTVFEDKLPTNFQIEWNARYTKTAGTFHYKGTPTSFNTKIVLSVKICDSPERVRDTLAHELCHAAVKLINNINESHGVFWKSWARKVNKTFPFMPVIARCHSYQISTKFTYECVDCKYRIGRHSKSLDTESKVCGHCHGKFQLYLTRELNSRSSDCETPVTPATPRTPNKFAMFVKECYSVVKQRGEGLRHSDVMKILSQEFAAKNKICD